MGDAFDREALFSCELSRLDVRETDTEEREDLSSDSIITEPNNPRGGLQKYSLCISPPALPGENVQELPSKGPGFHVSLWTVGFVSFLVLDCVLIGLLSKVCLDLAHLPEKSQPGFWDNATTARSTALLEDSPFCLPCSEVYLNEIEVLQNRSKVVQRRMGRGGEVWNDTLCCAEPHDDLKTLVGDMFIRVHYARDLAAGQVTVSNLTGTSDDVIEDDVIKPHLLLQLDKDVEPQEVNGTHTLPLKLSKREAPGTPAEQGNASSVFLQDGVLRIVHPGHFYIYSHVPFSFSLRPTTTLTQYVYRVRNGGETLLLENSVFPCDVSQPSCEHSFVGGVFLFESGDEIALRVSNYSYVEREEEVEFGVHRL